MVFLGIAFVALLLLLRWAGFEWRRDIDSPILGRQLASLPDLDAPIPTPALITHPTETAPDVVANLPALPQRCRKCSRTRNRLRDSARGPACSATGPDLQRWKR